MNFVHVFHAYLNSPQKSEHFGYTQVGLKKKSSSPSFRQNYFHQAPSVLELWLIVIVSMCHSSTKSTYLSLSMCH